MPTPAEAAFARALDGLGVRYVQNWTVRTAESLSGYYLVDFWLPGLRLCVEVDGAPHVGEVAVWKDRLRSEAIERAVSGARVVRVWNADVLRDPLLCVRGVMHMGAKFVQDAGSD